MVNWNMLKCAFGRHEFGRMLHDDIVDRWIKVCRNCSTITEVDAPRDENGEPIDSHVWLRMENDRDEKELSDRLDSILNAYTFNDD